MAVTAASFLPAAAASFSVADRGARNLTAWPRSTLSPADRASTSASASSAPAALTSSPAASGSVNGSLRKTPEDSNGSVLRHESKLVAEVEGVDDELESSAADYFEQAKILIRSDGGPPRSFSPLECSGGGRRIKNAPLLLYLPGIDGVSVGLTKDHRRLGKMFDVWCLHILVMDRTSFTDLVKMGENTVRLDYSTHQIDPYIYWENHLEDALLWSLQPVILTLIWF